MSKTKFIILKIIYCLLFAAWNFSLLYGVGRLNDGGEPNAVCCVAAIGCLIGDWVIEKRMNAQTDHSFKAFVPVGGFLLVSAMVIFAAWVHF